VTRPQNGELAFNSNGSFLYKPRLNFNGTDTFTYRASNQSRLLSEPVTVTITVKGENDAPTARPDSKSTKQNTPLVFPAADLLVNDSDPEHDHLTVTGVAATASTNGTVALGEDGKITYTPNANFAGTASFKYTVSDGKGGTASSTVSVAVLRNQPQQIVGRANGYGSLNGHKQFFFFNVYATEPGDSKSVRGHLAFFDIEKRFTFISTQINSFRIDGNTATFSGTGSVNGEPIYGFEASVTDNSSSGGGGGDTFRIRITDLLGAPQPNFNYEVQGTIDAFGNITVRKAAPQRGAGGLKLVRETDGSFVRRR
jgi:hypothetical protein